jgi:hypothetical protein
MAVRLGCVEPPLNDDLEWLDFLALDELPCALGLGGEQNMPRLLVEEAALVSPCAGAHRPPRVPLGTENAPKQGFPLGGCRCRQEIG